MKHKILKTIGIFAIFICIFTNTQTIFAANNKIQIVKKSEKEYMIYIEGNINSAFEFAFSNDKNPDKSTLVYRNSARDMETDDACYIGYIDEELYDTYFSEDTYIWARTSEDKYIAEGLKVDLKDYITSKDIELANTITKRIHVDTTQSYSKASEMIDDVKVTKSIGKIVVSEKGTTEYILEKVPESGDLYNFMIAVQNVSNGKIGNDYYSKLEASKELASLYNNLIPETNDNNWKEVSGGEILQPEEAHEGWKYVLWLKNTQSGKTKLDAQFLTCFEEYKPEVVSEKIVTKLPVTADDTTLFYILGVLIIFTTITVVTKIIVRKKYTKYN